MDTLEAVAVACGVVAIMHSFSDMEDDNAQRTCFRSPLKRRDRLCFDKVTEHFSDAEFINELRLSRR